MLCSHRLTSPFLSAWPPKLGPGIPLFCSRHPDYKVVATAPGDFEGMALNGGCMRTCDERLPCGHACTLV
jgi:hypothetical protein